MIPLYNYIAAIKGHNLEQRIASTDIEKYVVNDDGVLVETLIKTVKFEDGVVVQLEEEFEQVHFQEEGVCPECWISYEVLFSPESINISPNKKHFINRCQESFWLKINKAQLV
ncbi:TPA: hypothetical protein ACX6QH_002179 [Photobacterium damselae]